MTKLENQNKLFNATNSQINENHHPDKKEIIFPIKALFLKYFESASSYEQKLQTLDTLCEVLGLDKKEQEIVKTYKKAKLTVNDSKMKEKEE